MQNPVTDSLIRQLNKAKALSADENAFLKDYYHRLSGQDYSPERADHLLHAARIHLELAQKRAADTHLIRIDQSTSENNGLKSLVSIVTDDRPFIIDSLIITLGKLNKRIERTNHPIFEVTRTKRNKLVHIARRSANQPGQSNSRFTESFIQFETDGISAEETKSVIESLDAVLQHVRAVTMDWLEMKNAAVSLGEMIDQIKQGPGFAEYQALLNWMAKDNFAFIGYAEIEQSVKGNGSISNRVDSGSLKGILHAMHEENTDILSVLPPLVESTTAPLIFTKSRQRIHIHRDNYLDVILIDHDYGAVSKTRTRKRKISCIVGFLAGSTATTAISAIPHLRSKAAFILEKSTLRKRGYAYKSLRTIIETLPRELIFQLGSQALYNLCMTLLNHLERSRTRLHLKHNVCGHFYTCLVYVPKDLFNTALRKRIQTHIETRLGATEVTFNVRFSESVLTQIHFTAFVDKPLGKKIDPAVLEREVQLMAQDWEDHLLHQIESQLPVEQANAVASNWRGGFSPRYRLDHDAEAALADVLLLEQNQVIDLGATATQGLITGKVVCDAADRASHLRLYSADQSMSLSDALPILDNMGLRVPGEHPYSIQHHDGQVYWINHFKIIDKNHQKLAAELKQVIEEGFIATWFGSCENDGFNQLIVLTGLGWRQISIVRCYFRYLKQIRLRYSEGHIIESLAKYPQLVTAIIRLFECRFDPSGKSDSVDEYMQEIKKRLADIQTLDEERIFRALIDTVNATVRTNYFQSNDGEAKSTISLKLAPRSIPRIPEPAPLHEIFVYSSRMEGVHLRGGDVARGGLRWSERPDDFRTEVLGLVKAQQVKNAVIVPVGSKGGFIAKQLPAGDRDEIQKEVISCYRLFISGLLDITDNIVGKKIVPPKNCVRLDGDDPYLVVAADKGTATFSDIANGISTDASFWLGDAFASGGSAGYDHKKMGITARGAWESVKRHFREQGKDVQNQDFTVVGVGDMGGDVFGNGMLLSKHIRLIAAFNHLHIFIDPDPDSAKSHVERKRLFDLPRSSWTDYNEKLISKGGGIYARSAKSITLSKQAMQALSTSQNQFTPDELIHTILKSEVELLWNGGIGTYIKADSETDADAQDRNNDALRVDASELRIKVIGEGGNLGLTQMARIQFNTLGGYCYTDAIDNSAGVDTSDHEVNIKILLNQLVAKNKLSMPERNRVLEKMEVAVGEHVLKNNYVQTEILSIEGNFAMERMHGHVQAMQSLSDSGLLKRDIEQLPNDAELVERAAQASPLTRAELAVVLAYSKMDLYDRVLQSEIPEQKHMQPVLLSYFPDLLIKKYESSVIRHPLGKEIVSTVVTNDLVGTMGPAFHFRMADATGASHVDVVRAYLVAKSLLGTDQLIESVRLTDNRLESALQQRLLLEIAGAIESCVFWLLDNHADSLDIPRLCKKYEKSVNAFHTVLRKTEESAIPAVYRQLNAKLDSVADLAKKTVDLRHIWALPWCLDIVHIALQQKASVAKVMQCYLSVQQELELGKIRTHILSLPAEDKWRQQARSALASSLRHSHGSITSAILTETAKLPAKRGLENWMQKQSSRVDKIMSMQQAVELEAAPDFALLSVLVNELTKLAHAG